jgi:hypothetical protein
MEELVGEDGGGRISFVGSNIFIQVPTLLSLPLSLSCLGKLYCGSHIVLSCRSRV